MENVITCPNCGEENRAVKKMCYSCFTPLKSFPIPAKAARNIQIVKDRDDNMTFKEIAVKQGISIERVRQIYEQAQRRKAKA